MVAGSTCLQPATTKASSCESAMTAPAFPRSFSAASSIPSSPPNPSAREPVSDSTSPDAPSATTTAPSSSTPNPATPNSASDSPSQRLARTWSANNSTFSWKTDLQHTRRVDIPHKPNNRGRRLRKIKEALVTLGKPRKYSFEPRLRDTIHLPEFLQIEAGYQLFEPRIVSKIVVEGIDLKRSNAWAMISKSPVEIAHDLVCLAESRIYSRHRAGLRPITCYSIANLPPVPFDTGFLIGGTESGQFLGFGALD